MKTVFIEAEHSLNWGKFCVGKFDSEEQERKSDVDMYKRELLGNCGWFGNFVWVFDLQTGEGACFKPGGVASADLHKHKIWVCPMFEPFLEWLYKQDLTDLDKLPKVVKIGNEIQGEFRGYRRPGTVEAGPMKQFLRDYIRKYGTTPDDNNVSKALVKIHSGKTFVVDDFVIKITNEQVLITNVEVL